MKIQSIGVDIEEIGRFKKMSYSRNRNFYEKIFTGGEIAYCLSKDDPYSHFAARFAAKEAVIKALGSTVYRVKGVEIVNNKNGAPLVKIKKLNSKILISL